MRSFISLKVLLPQLGLTDLEWAQRRVLRLVRDGTIEQSEYSVSRHGEIKRGQPRKEYALSRLGAYLFAMAVRTTQADEWRRLQAERLNALMEANASNALPSAPVTPASLEALAARVEQLEARLAPVEVRVEDIKAKLEGRFPKQLFLAGVSEPSLDLASAGAWLANRGNEEFTLPELIEGAQLNAFNGAALKKLGLLLVRLGWRARARVRRGDRQLRVYRRVDVTTH